MIYLEKSTSNGYMALEIDHSNYLVSYSATTQNGDNFYSHNIAKLANPPVKKYYSSNWTKNIPNLIGPFPSWESLTTAYDDYPELFI